MPARNTPIGVRRRLDAAYRDIVEGLRALHPALVIKPEVPNAVIELASDDEGAQVTFKPIVCRVPEQARRRGAANLYVVVRGRCELVLADGPSGVMTRSYATEFGYFRDRGGVVEHCYGGHYDYDAVKDAHPIAHLQIRSQQRLQEHIGRHFRLPAHEDKDLLTGVLDRVRTPTLQMDVLSTLVQIAADHLMHDKSTDEERRLFRRLTTTGVPFRGYAPVPPPADDPCTCPRGVHAYRRRAPAAP